MRPEAEASGYPSVATPIGLALDLLAVEVGGDETAIGGEAVKVGRCAGVKESMAEQPRGVVAGEARGFGERDSGEAL